MRCNGSHYLLSNFVRQITEVKNYFSDHKKQYDDQLRRYQAAHPDDDRPGTAFLFGANAKPDQAEVLAAFPQKPIADQLITRYFITYDPALRKSKRLGTTSPS